MTRRATEAEGVAARGAGMDPAVYAGWIDAGFADEEIGAWYPVTCSRESGPGTAARLRRAGVSPARWWDAVDGVLHGRVDLDAETATGAADAAVLWDDVVRHLHAATRAAAVARGEAVAVAGALGYSSSLLARRLAWPAGVGRRLPGRLRAPAHQSRPGTRERNPR